MPQPPAQGQAVAAASGATVVVPAAAGGAAAAASVGGTVALGAATAAVVTGLVAFLGALRQRQQAWLVAQLGRYSSRVDDIREAVAQEQARGEEFARRSAERVASAMPQALAIADEAQRVARVRQIMADEERYARQRSEAMMARAIAAVSRMSLKRESPLGAYWELGHAQQHTEGCQFMHGKFWPWAVLDRVHPPRHYGCTSRLRSFGDAVHAGLMSAGDVPDTRDAIRAAAGVMMEEEDAAALERELELREQLVASGADPVALAQIPWLGLLEAFADGKHPRDWRGRFRTVGDVAKGITDTMIAWQGGSLPSDAPSREQIVANWTKQVRGRLSKDRVALGILKAAQEENAANPRWQAIVRGRPADHVIVTHKPEAERRTSTLLATHGEAASRKAHTTVIDDGAVKEIGLQGSKKSPKEHPAATSGYGLAAVLRHEYGHSIDDTLPREVRRGILNAIPDAEHDLTYYAGTGDQEVIPELLATITHPDYRSADWPETVQEAERRLLAALGVKLPKQGSKGVEDGAAT